MGVRLAAGVAMVAVALLGFTVAVPQDNRLGITSSFEDLFSAGGANLAAVDAVGLDDEDLGRLIDRIDGLGLDPDTAIHIEPEALARMLERMSPEELAALGLTPEEARDIIARLRDPDLTDEELRAIATDLSDRGLGFGNLNGDGRFDPGEIAYIDVDGDGRVSAGDVRLGLLALLLGTDRLLHDEAAALLDAYEAAGAVGIERPASASERDTATAQTAPLLVAGYPTDRAIGPSPVVCVPLYSPSLTCHTRTFAHGAVVDRGSYYLFRLDTSTRTVLKAESSAPGLRSTGTVILDLGGSVWTPVPALTPGDRLIGSDRSDITLARDGNGMLWARGPVGRQAVNLTWAVDLAYYDLPVAADVRRDDVPAALQPSLDSESAAIGLRIAGLAGAQGRDYGDGIRALAAYFRAFGPGALPDRGERADDLLAIAEAQTGCARHRAAAFTLAAQSLGVPTRLIVNEAHAFAEVFVPKAGWHLVDLGACGSLQVYPRSHEEIMAHQDLPYADGDAPRSQASRSQAPASTRIDITESPSSLRKNTDFTIAGIASSPDGDLPAGIPITFTYNRTKDSPGTPFCSTQTAAGGDYRATCRIGSEAPAGSLQLVARLAPSVVAGAPSAISYSDPPFVVQKATRLNLTGPALTSADVSVAYTVAAVDEDGKPVPQRLVELRVDGGPAKTQPTDGSGRAHFTFQVAAGRHTLAARLPGDDTYDPSNATLTIEATTLRLALQVLPSVLQEGRLVVNGLLVDADGGAGARPIVASWTPAPGQDALTAASLTSGGGGFQLRFEGTVPPGAGVVTVREPASGVAVAAAFARSVDAAATLEVPERWAAGRPVPVTLRTEGASDLLPVRLTVDGEAVADLLASDASPAQHLVTAAAGRHTLALQAGDGVVLSYSPVAFHVGRAEVLVAAPAPSPPGTTVSVAGSVRFEGEPMAGRVVLRLQGAEAEAQADAGGAFRVLLRLPDDATPGQSTAILEMPELGAQQEVPMRIERPANLDIDAPQVSLNAFGTTGIIVRGEGTVTVTADGRPLGPGGRLEVPSDAFLWRVITLEARAVPDADGLAPSTRTTSIVVLNPITVVGLPLLLGLAAWGAARAVAEVRRRRAHRNRFLPPRPATRVQVVSPALPPRVPLVFDPAQDTQVVFRLPHAGPWRLRDASGRPVPFTAQGRDAVLEVARLGTGRHELRFDDGKRAFPLRITVQDLRGALDEATLALMARIGQATPWPAPLDGLEQGLRDRDAAPEDAATVRRHAEEALYAQKRVGREAFHAFFAALDQAQARRPA